jgi:excisionase family DNA binding protein
MTQLELISFRQASVLTNVSERTLTRMADRGELTVFWFGKTKRLSVQELVCD